jgi:formyltetrahydrofolate deformylase
VAPGAMEKGDYQMLRNPAISLCPQREGHMNPRLPRLAIFVSRHDHCLADLLRAYRNGELHCRVQVVISNHHDLRAHAEAYGIAFHHVPVARERRDEAEHIQLELLREQRIDLVVLARYMQILSPHFVRQYENRIINIHHSLLPAFAGAMPYQRAFERGVKIIGATAHYVTETLDDGPIIEQDAIRVGHRDGVEDLIRKGAELEKAILTRAVKWHVDQRIRIHLNKTVVVDRDVNIAQPMRERGHGAHE